MSRNPGVDGLAAIAILGMASLMAVGLGLSGIALRSKHVLDAYRQPQTSGLVEAVHLRERGPALAGRPRAGDTITVRYRDATCAGIAVADPLGLLIAYALIPTLLAGVIAATQIWGIIDTARTVRTMGIART